MLNQSELKRHHPQEDGNAAQCSKINRQVDGGRIVHVLSLPQEPRQNIPAIFVLFVFSYWNVCLRSLHGRACVTMSNVVHICTDRLSLATRIFMDMFSIFKTNKFGERIHNSLKLWQM